MHRTTPPRIAAPSRRAAWILTAAVAAAALQGCASPPPHRPPPGSVEDPVPLALYPNINVHRPLTPYILVADPIVERDRAGTLRVDVPIRANTRPHEDLNVQYRFQFLDDRGRPLPPEPEWAYVRLDPTIQAFVSANAMDSRAVDWRLEIRPAR